MLSIKDIESSIGSLYSGLQGTWEKVKVDVILHVIILFVVFQIIKVSLPEFPDVKIDLTELQANEWYKLAKEFKLLFLIPLLAIGLIIAYGAIVRLLGRVLVTIATILFSPTNLFDYKFFNKLPVSDLELIALHLNDKKRFYFHDLYNAIAILMMTYKTKYKEDYESFQKNLNETSNNANIYFGNAAVFLFIWLGLFWYLPDNSTWEKNNEPHFWSVVFFLLAILILARQRMIRALKMVPFMQAVYVCYFLKIDPETKNLLQQNEKEIDVIHKRLEELRSIETEKDKPSLLRYMSDRIFPPNKYGEKRSNGFPLYKLYETGKRFEREHEEMKDEWIPGYIAYSYYRIHCALTEKAKMIKQVVIFAIKGVDE